MGCSIDNRQPFFMNKIIEILNIKKSYTNKTGIITQVLNGLNLDVINGEILSIMGPSGAGKSTLLHLIGLLDTYDDGSIKFYINDRLQEPVNFNDSYKSKFRNKYLGFIFQFYHLLPEFTAIENVMMPALIFGDKFKIAREKALNLIKLVELENKINNKPNELSGGEQQRIAIARALINEPAIILADEPTGNLDTKNSDNIIQIIKNINQEKNITFIIATHSQELSNIAHRILKLKDGKLIE